MLRNFLVTTVIILAAGWLFWGYSRFNPAVEADRQKEVDDLVDAVLERVPAAGAEEDEFGGAAPSAARRVELKWTPESTPPWSHLTSELREKIGGVIDAGGGSAAWDGLVIHASLTPEGDASALEHYFRDVQNQAGGMPFHFVIGNGTWSGDGAVEAGERWQQQAPVKEGENLIHICVVGDFSHRVPSPEQMAALAELLIFLESKLGHLPVFAHAAAGEGGGTGVCPGEGFFRAWGEFSEIRKDS